MKYLALLFILFTLGGCANPNTMLVNPNTGEYRNCASSGWGYVGAPMAIMSHDSCVESLQSIGFVFVHDVKPCVITIKTDPAGAKIYSGQTKETLNTLSGTSPITITTDKGIIGWAKECYQARKEGYSDSDIKCFDEGPGNRSVFLTLAKKQ